MELDVDVDVLISISAALAAGACFAVAGVLQQRAASRQPEEQRMSFRLLRELATQPMWLTGIMLAVLAYAFQSLALAFGPLSLVQPLIISELIFAIPLSAWMYQMRLHARDRLGLFAVTAGLGTAIVAAQPREGHPVADLYGWAFTLIAVGGGTAAALFVSRYVRGPAKASLIALAAGIVMGSQSVFLTSTIARFREGAVLAVLTAAQTYLLVAASIGGLLLIQSAFQAGPLSASMPVMDVTEPTVAVTIGVALFSETVRTGLLAGSLALGGLLLLLWGIVLLDTSPMLKALYEREESGERPGGPRTPASGSGDGTRPALRAGGVPACRRGTSCRAKRRPPRHDTG